jgi:hypothetical protein
MYLLFHYYYYYYFEFCSVFWLQEAGPHPNDVCNPMSYHFILHDYVSSENFLTYLKLYIMYGKRHGTDALFILFVQAGSILCLWGTLQVPEFLLVVWYYSMFLDTCGNCPSARSGSVANLVRRNVHIFMKLVNSVQHILCSCHIFVCCCTNANLSCKLCSCWAALVEFNGAIETVIDVLSCSLLILFLFRPLLWYLFCIFMYFCDYLCICSGFVTGLGLLFQHANKRVCNGI